MSVMGRLYRGETEFDFVGQRMRWFRISAVLLGVTLLALVFFQLNLSLDFRGGVAVQVENPANLDVAQMRSALTPIGQDAARIQLIEDGAAVRVQTEALDPDAEQRLVRTVADAVGVPVTEASIDAVGPTFGSQITSRALLALVVFLGVVVLYITWRLEWKMAGSGIVALLHDLLITAGVYSVFQLEVTPATVVAILTILGYSLYDTVVVFDKVNENVAEFHDVETYSGIVNLSMNQVLMRSINTSLTTLLPIGSLLLVGSFLLGARTLREFAVALFVGVAASTYSSLFIASPMLAVWKEQEPDWQRRRARLERKTGATSEPGVASADDRPSAGRPPTGTGATPRPPKRRKR